MNKYKFFYFTGTADGEQEIITCDVIADDVIEAVKNFKANFPKESKSILEIIDEKNIKSYWGNATIDNLRRFHNLLIKSGGNKFMSNGLLISASPLGC